jgi:tetratricopeptide (TPR) repeat protein
MPKESTSVTFAALLLLGVLSVPAVARAADEARPVAHLLAPAQEYAICYDPLMAEAALRLTAIDLAARHGLYARCRPADRVAELPDDAWPRLELFVDWGPKLRHVRLKREGDTFIFLARADDTGYVELNRRTLRMPPALSVGLMACATPAEETLEAVVLDARLNGEPFSGYESAEIGRCIAPCAATEEEGRITFRTSPPFDGRNAFDKGIFLHKPCEGDFDITCTVELSSPASTRCIGVMCREAPAEGAPSAATLTDGGEAAGCARTPPFQSLQWHYDTGAHFVRIELALGPDEVRDLGLVYLSCGTWEALADSVRRLSEAVETGLAKELGLETANGRAAATPDEATSSALREARDLAWTAVSGRVYAASRRVDALLEDAPTCAEAHALGAECGALLAAQDLYGVFSDRPRFLARPLAHWLFAERLAGAEAGRYGMTQGYVALACGYPKAALALLSSLPETEQAGPKAKALRMYATRDCRPFTQDTFGLAAPIEELAWFWAAVECARDDFFADAPLDTTWAAESCAFMPLYRSPSVGSGHRYTAAGPLIAALRDVTDFLGCDEIPVEQRTEIAVKLAEALKLPPGQDLAETVKEVRSALKERSRTAVGQWRPLMELYSAALAVPEPRPGVDGRLPWRTVGLHDFAENQRGMFLLMLYMRANFVSQMLASYEQALTYCKELAELTSDVPGASTYFTAVGLMSVGRTEETLPGLREFTMTPLGRRPALLAFTFEDWPHVSGFVNFNVTSLESALLPPGRGSWDWSALASIWRARGNNDWGMRNAVAWNALDVDDYTVSPVLALMDIAENIAPGVEAVDRSPYNLKLLEAVAKKALALQDIDTGAEMYERMIAAAPAEVTAYNRLALLYAKEDKLRAIAVAKRAEENCPWGVALSNLLGRCAVWMVDEGNREEALRYGEKASGTGSFPGLMGYATALIANDRKEEGIKIWRQIAFRYPARCDRYFDLIFKEKYPDDKIMEDARQLLARHPSMKPQILQRFDSVARQYPGGADLVARAHEIAGESGGN